MHPISDRNSNVYVATSLARPWATNDDAVHLPVRSCFNSKPPYRDGTTHFVMPPLEFLQRSAALVPRPQLYLIRFPAVLAPNAALRSQIVPTNPYQANDADDPPLGPTIGAGSGLATMHFPSRDHLSWSGRDGSHVCFPGEGCLISKAGTGAFLISFYAGVRPGSRGHFLSGKGPKTMVAVAWPFGRPASFADFGGAQTHDAQTMRAFLRRRLHDLASPQGHGIPIMV